MIKLVASDIDGTLLVEGTDKINPEIFSVIRQLKEKGITFAAASGRQYASIHYLFRPVADDIIYITDNGSCIIYEGKCMRAAVMDRAVLTELVEEIRRIPGCFVFVSSTEGDGYVENPTPELVDFLVNGYHNTIHQSEDVLAEPIQIIKCSIYKENGILELEPGFTERFGSRLNVAIAGDIWLDFMNLDSDKGRAVRAIQEMLHVSPEETMSFGDNMNDLGLILSAGESYAVENAVPAIKAAAKHLTDKNTEDGVLKVLKRLLEEQPDSRQ